MTDVCPFPDIKHGERIISSVIEEKANDLSKVWVTTPINPTDLSQGFKDVTYRQLNDAANRAAKWLRDALPKTDKPFQPFVYVATKDIRYGVFAVAAAKLQKVIIFMSPMASVEAQFHILKKQNCTAYVHTADIPTTSISDKDNDLVFLSPPSVESLFEDEPSPEVFNYPKSWATGKDDPWLCFHTSGTTGLPRPVVYTHSMMACFDRAAMIPALPLNHLHQYAKTRWYTPLPALHFAGMLQLISMTTYLDCIVVIGPPIPLSWKVMADIITYGKVDGAILPPVLIDMLCAEPQGLAAARSLKFIHFVGAPLSAKSGNNLKDSVHLVPSIGSTETGGYFTKITTKDHPAYTEWDYVEFQEHSGAEFRLHSEDLYELVFVNDPAYLIQPIFELYPEISIYETKDLWKRHSTFPNHYKLIGRVDDYISFAHAGGIHAAKIEQSIVENAMIKAALIGAQGSPWPILLLETEKDQSQWSTEQANKFYSVLDDQIQNINASLHEKVHLDSKHIIFAKADKPFSRTEKGSVGRYQTLKRYEPEIAALISSES